ncbi:MAG: hypothetical protein E5V51_02155 [Mesorhizobium sp.]|nr:MAG: hypothetical protein E5V51_02155 [Mesorhizobium sp.]
MITPSVLQVRLSAARVSWILWQSARAQPHRVDTVESGSKMMRYDRDKAGARTHCGTGGQHFALARTPDILGQIKIMHPGGNCSTGNADS